jgi:RND family efflux transporter MFP subunit
MRFGRILGFAVLLALAGAGALWASGWRPAIEVTAVQPRRGSAAEVVYATGAVEPLRWSKVVSLQRKRVTDLCLCEGDTVKKGDPLARLDDTEERAQLREMEATRAQRQRDFERLTALLERNAATQTAVDQARTVLTEIDARIMAQKDRIDELVLRAPMDGVVLRRDGEIGEIAGQSDVLFWVGQPKPLQITADVNEEDILKVQSGQRALLRNEGLGGATVEARVNDITPKGDPATKTFRVHLSLPDDTPLRIGMSVEANIVVREKTNVILIPADAISEGHVFRFDDGRARRVAVTTGIRGGRMVEVVSGVNEGDTIIAPTVAGLVDGAHVRLKR